MPLKGKIDDLITFELKNLYLSKGTINNTQEGGTPTEWGKILVVHISDEDFYPE